MADIARIKRNIQKMIDQDAPETDIDSYVASEGISIAELQGEVPVEPTSIAPPIPQEIPSDIQQFGQALAQGQDVGISPIAPPIDEFGAIIPQPRAELSSEEAAQVAISLNEGYRVLGSAVQHTPESAVRFGQEIYQAIRHPIQTATGIKDLGIGVAQLLIPGEQGKEDVARTVGQFFRERYGGLEEAVNTFETDPVGFLADLSVVISGVGAGVRAVGTAGKVGLLTKAGKAIQVTGKAVDPIRVVTSGVGEAAQLGRPIVKELLGVTTGAGAESIEQAIRGSKQFRAAMRGDIPGGEIVESARRGMQVLKEQRADRYVGQLEEISKIKKSIPITPLIEGLERNLKRFNVRRVSRSADFPDGLDFKRSVMRLDKPAQKKITQIVDEIDKLGLQRGGRTPVNLDILKRVFDDMFSETSSVQAFTSDMANKTRQLLIDNVDGYKAMVKDYEKASRLMNEMDVTLALRKGRTPEQVLRRLTQGLKEDATFKRDFIRLLGDASGEDIMAKIAGLNLNKPLPSGGLSKLLGAGELAFLLRFDPSLIPILFTNSPRAVGEFFNAMRIPVKAAKKAAREAERVGVPAFQAGRPARIEERRRPTIEITGEGFRVE